MLGVLEERVEGVLEGLGVDQVVVTGVSTNVCVEGTVRDAFAEGFGVVVVGDATGALSGEAHGTSVKSVGWGSAEIAKTVEVMDAVRAGAGKGVGLLVAVIETELVLVGREV